MTSVIRHPPSTGDPLHFAQLMDHAWRAFRELLGELVRPAVAAASGTTLRPSQVRLLSLTPATGMRVTDLAARVGMTKQALGEFVATLREAGLVEVTVDQRDRRVRLVRPTAAGRRLQGQVESAIAELERRWRDEVGEQRWATFREVLAQIGGDAAAGPS
jgi:DNA-binding MarR family transcriptional regulator